MSLKEKKLNPFALVFWAALGCAGYLIGDAKGAVAGILIGLVLSIVAQVVDRR